MLYFIDPKKDATKTIVEKLKSYEQIKFVSLVAVDLGNHHTDERIPLSQVIDDFEAFLQQGIQTDGSSVVLPLIADINNAKVDIIPDTTVKWFIDYNHGHLDPKTNKPVGTLIIPSFLQHNDKFVCSRSILRKAEDHLNESLVKLINEHDAAKEELGLEAPVKKAEFTLATELEFWVMSPDDPIDEAKLSTSQTLKEQYWKRTVGNVRSAMEAALLALEAYGFSPEMGHKEVGGVHSKLRGNNDFTAVMEQIEIDWKYDLALQSADHEMLAKDIIYDVYTRFGLDVTFKAKPIEGVAGSGEHHHLGITLTLEDGQKKNLFAPKVLTEDYMTRFGYGALMGILRNYELINPFVSSTNDAFNRLKPGFEAPVCVVSSLGHHQETPSRNRTVLIGLIRDMMASHATRFELRAPNPNTNTYLATAAIIQVMLDGMKYAMTKSPEDLLAELSKEAKEAADYLEDARAYRSELDVFEAYSQEERNERFGKAPATVFENLQQFQSSPYQKLLLENEVFTQEVLNSYVSGIRSQWKTELIERIIPDAIETLRGLVPLHADDAFNELDSVIWEEILTKKVALMKNTHTKNALFTELASAIDRGDYAIASQLQTTMQTKLSELKNLYRSYASNIINLH